MLARRPYEDLTGTERDNRAKIKIIDYARRNRMTQMVKKEDEEFVKNADLESKKKRYINIADQFMVTLNQSLNYFGILPGHGQGPPVVKFQKEDRIPKFYDNDPKLEYYNQQLRDLIQSILKEIPVDDPFLKKLKKKNTSLNEILEKYIQLFRPRIQNGVQITDYNLAGMKGVNEADVDQNFFKTIDNLSKLINDNNDTILYLESTPRSGQGRKKYNIDTTEYIIPSKYL